MSTFSISSYSELYKVIIWKLFDFAFCKCSACIPQYPFSSLWCDFHPVRLQRFWRVWLRVPGWAWARGDHPFASSPVPNYTWLEWLAFFLGYRKAKEYPFKFNQPFLGLLSFGRKIRCQWHFFWLPGKRLKWSYIQWSVWPSPHPLCC